MTFQQFHMPGGYQFDSPQQSGPALSAGIFRAPASPSASSSSVFNLAKSSGSLCSDAPNAHNGGGAKRKRNLNLAARQPRAPTPLQEWGSLSIDTSSDRAGPTGFFDYASPKVGTSDAEAKGHVYTLAGQIETPGADSNGCDHNCLEDSVYSDVDYRRGMGSKRTRGDLEDPLSNTLNAHSALSRSHNMGATDFTFSLPPNGGSGWGAFAFGALGGVVGRVWQFCKAGAFRGFSAGGGSRYPVDDHHGHGFVRQSPVPSPTYDREEAEDMDSLRQNSGTPDSLPRHAVKRRQTEKGPEDLKNWIVVSDRSPTPTNLASRRQTTYEEKRQPSKPASRATSRASSRLSHSHRPSVPASRRSMHGSVCSSATTLSMNGRPSSRLSQAGRESASFAAPRSPMSTTSFIPVLNASPSRIPVPTSRLGINPFAVPPAADATTTEQSPITPATPSRSSNGFATVGASALNFSASGSAHGNGHRRGRPSSTSPRRKTSVSAVPHISTVFGAGAMDDSTVAAADSPRLDPEARKIAARRAAEEREADARMEALNAQLRQMIRQGREALGTRVTVEDDEMETTAPSAWVDAED
ncbi:hypothetical protein RB595_006056 [Gaeumannomyces hyphopodioides]